MLLPYQPERISTTSLPVAFQPPSEYRTMSRVTESYLNPLGRPRPSNRISYFCSAPNRREKEQHLKRQVFLKKVREAGDNRKWLLHGEKVSMLGLYNGYTLMDSLLGITDIEGGLRFESKAVGSKTV